MEYQQLYNNLKEAFRQNGESVSYKGIKFIRQEFLSAGYHVLPGKNKYACKLHGASFHENYAGSLSPLDISDIHIPENKYFPYYIAVPDSEKSFNRAILLLHGLNERSWDKYLPWAWQLAALTNSPVILFPIAFHMERAPVAWSDCRLMNAFVKERQTAHTDSSNLSFINTAISYRLAQHPDRLFWSGFQTYIDIISLSKKIRSGRMPLFSEGTALDLFGYSMGAFLSLILLMANPKEYFSDSRLFAFCGGTTLDRTYTISKYILDSNASVSIASYFSEQLYNGFRSSERLEHYMNRHIKEGHFKFMLNHNYYKKERESAIKLIADRILAVPLVRDKVIPPVEVMNTLQGDYRTVPVKVNPMDFGFPYDHEHPFSVVTKYAQEVDRAFKNVIQTAADHFNRKSAHTVRAADLSLKPARISEKEIPFVFQKNGIDALKAKG